MSNLIGPYPFGGLGIYTSINLEKQEDTTGTCLIRETLPPHEEYGYYSELGIINQSNILLNVLDFNGDVREIYPSSVSRVVAEHGYTKMAKVIEENVLDNIEESVKPDNPDGKIIFRFSCKYNSPDNKIGPPVKRNIPSTAIPSGGTSPIYTYTLDVKRVFGKIGDGIVYLEDLNLFIQRGLTEKYKEKQAERKKRLAYTRLDQFTQQFMMQHLVDITNGGFKYLDIHYSHNGNYKTSLYYYIDNSEIFESVNTFNLDGPNISMYSSILFDDVHSEVKNDKSMNARIINKEIVKRIQDGDEVITFKLFNNSDSTITLSTNRAKIEDHRRSMLETKEKHKQDTIKELVEDRLDKLDKTERIKNDEVELRINELENKLDKAKQELESANGELKAYRENANAEFKYQKAILDRDFKEQEYYHKRALDELNIFTAGLKTIAVTAPIIAGGAMWLTKTGLFAGAATAAVVGLTSTTATAGAIGATAAATTAGLFGLGSLFNLFTIGVVAGAGYYYYKKQIKTVENLKSTIVKACEWVGEKASKIWNRFTDLFR